MLDARKLWVVARFELLEALQSRLFIVVVAMYGAGATIGSYAFLKTVEAAERTARSTLAQSMKVDESQLPANLVREQVLPLFTRLVDDRSIQQELLRMPPLSIFYGFMALNLVALLVLAVSSGTMAADLSSGASRYVLFRCDRLTWATGKLLGQEMLLATGLLVGALLAGAVGVTIEPGFKPDDWVWLLRTSFRALLYASSYLGLFAGISLCARSPMGARAMALFLWIGCGIAHTIVTAEFLNRRVPYLHFFGVVFPADHRQALWSPDWGTYLPAVAALLMIGTFGFFVGHRVFQGRDA